MTLTTSYTHGPSDVAAARRDHRGQPGRHRRPLSATARPWSSAQRAGAGPTPSCTRGPGRSPGALLARGVAPATGWASGRPTAPSGSALQYGTALIGAVLVNINPAYRTSELAYVLRQSGVRTLVSATTFKTSDYRAMVETVRAAASCPDLARRGVDRRAVAGTELEAAGASVDERRARCRARPSLSCDDPINIQYTSGTTGFPKGATLSHHNILNNGYFIGELLGYTEADRICVPVPFYHCFGMVIGNLAATSHGVGGRRPGAAVRPGATLAAVGGRALHLAVRGADDVHRRARPTRRSPTTDLLVAAHRGHGRLAVPRRGHEAGDRRDAHGRGGHLLRHDRDVAGVHPDPRRRRPRAADGDGRAGDAAPRDQGRRPGDRPHGPAAAPPASCAPAATR